MDETGLRRLCGHWPGVGTDIKWDDDLVFMVDGKMFACLCIGGKRRGKLAFKVEPECFLAFTDRPGIVPAPYMARAHWIAMDDPGVMPKAELEALLRRAYGLVRARLPKKRQRELAD